tara:strand:+ start:998 stop:2320 length:1323 start_codon:yes stop_codon:yes gene_type:complete
MKLFFTSILLIIISGCSFDNKSGIWKSGNEVNSKIENRFEGFETLYAKTKSFDSLIKPKIDLKIVLDQVQLNLNWTDEYYKNSNSLDNFSYNDLNQVILKSQKLSKNKIKKRLLYNSQRAIITDDKGNIIVYSVENQNIILKYNFYKKKFKKIKKNLNIIIEKNIIFIGDNFGYLYALDHVSKKLLWAKNYKVPFRSNLKIIGQTLLISDINNSLYFIDKLSGNKLNMLPTEDTIIKNNFFNSLALSNETIFYLNTYGSLYAITHKGRIKWFINLNQSLDINPNNLFYSHPLILHKDKLLVSTDLYLYILDQKNGSTNHKIAITSLFNPVVSGDSLFIVTKDNLLVCISPSTGKILYSIDIDRNIANFLDTKKKSVNIKSLAIINNDLFLFLNNSYVVKFSADGKIKDIVKLSFKLNSLPIFIEDSIIYINNKNKLIITN